MASGDNNLTGYIIHYGTEGEGHSVMAAASDTRVTITGLISGATYSISIEATSNTLPSVSIRFTQSITIGNTTNDIVIDIHLLKQVTFPSLLLPLQMCWLEI